MKYAIHVIVVRSFLEEKRLFYFSDTEIFGMFSFEILIIQFNITHIFL